jgi:hypothetical protein
VNLLQGKNMSYFEERLLNDAAEAEDAWRIVVCFQPQKKCFLFDFFI